MRRSRTVIVTSIVLATVLGLLSLVGFVGFSRLRHSIDQVNTATDRLTAYEHVQRTLANEGFAEAGYRRAPSELSRGKVLAALAQLEVAVEDVRTVGTPNDSATVTYLLVLNQRYADELKSQLGAAGSAPRVSADDGVAGPSLDAMEQLLDAAVARYSAELRAASAHQSDLVTRMAWRAPLVLLGAAAALALSWALLVAHTRRSARRAEQSEQLALHDALTGLANRRAFERTLAKELRREDPDTAVLLLDLDGFKAINDTWGHDVGDEVLRAVAQRMTETVRSTDVVARLGGDEFAVVARPTQQAELLSQRLRMAISRPLQVGGVLLHPGVSVGWSPVAAGTTREDVLREADRLLYDEKRAHSTNGRRLGRGA